MSSRVSHAVEAAVGCARELGLPAGEPRLLHDGANVVLHLAPAPVVARVATRTAVLRLDVAGHFAREVELATALTVMGAPVVPPSDLVPPGPHQRDGLILSFWRFEQLTGEQPTPAIAGQSLGELHETLAHFPPPAGRLLDTPLDDIASFVRVGRTVGTNPRSVDQVADLADRLRPQLVGELGALHGDAHPGNLLATARGWLWSDLEDTCPGPVGWDLACLRTTRRLDGRAAVAATPFPATDAELAPWLALRALHVAIWWQIIAAGSPADRVAGDERLRQAIDQVGAHLSC